MVTKTQTYQNQKFTKLSNHYTPSKRKGSLLYGLWVSITTFLATFPGNQRRVSHYNSLGICVEFLENLVLMFCLYISYQVFHSSSFSKCLQECPKRSSNRVRSSLSYYKTFFNLRTKSRYFFLFYFLFFNITQSTARTVTYFIWKISLCLQ